MQHWESSPWDLGAAVPENVSGGAGEEGVGMQTQTRRALAQCKVQQQRAELHLAWLIQHSLPRATEKLPLSSQGLEWEPNQPPKSCLTRAC